MPAVSLPAPHGVFATSRHVGPYLPAFLKLSFLFQTFQEVGRMEVMGSHEKEAPVTAATGTASPPSGPDSELINASGHVQEVDRK